MFKEYPQFQSNEILTYLRKSRSDDPSLTVEEVLSKHETILQEWQQHNLTSSIPNENIYREVVSGETINSRPEFKKLLKRIESPQIKAVLVVECARLGRPDLEEIGRISKLFRYTGTYIITLQKTFDLSDEYDREQFERELMRGNDYLEYTKKILNRGKEISLRSGWYIGSIAPFGYNRIWVLENGRKRPTLEINKDEAVIVKYVFDWYANSDIGATKIANKLNAAGFRNRKGGIWKKPVIETMLKNEHYIGKIVIKKHIEVNTVKDQRVIAQRIRSKNYDVVEGKHPAIIDEQTFKKANDKLLKFPSVKPSETLQNPFASILKCECGRTMLRRKDRKWYRYICDERMYCHNSSVKEDELISSVVDILKQSMQNLTAEITSDANAKKQKHIEYTLMLKSRYVECENKELALWEKYTDEEMPKNIFDKLLQKNTEEKKEIEHELEIAESNVMPTVDYAGVIATLHEAINSLTNDSIPASEKNSLLKSVINKIVYKRPKSTRVDPDVPHKNTGRKGWKSLPFELDVDMNI